MLDPGDTMSFFTLYVVMRFYMCPDNLLEPFSFSMHVGYFIIAKQFHISCPVFVSHRVIHVKLVYLDTVDFNSIIGMS